MIESHSSPEHYTACMLYRFTNKKWRIEHLTGSRALIDRHKEPLLYHKLTKRISVASAMKEVLYSEIIKYSPQR